MVENITNADKYKYTWIKAVGFSSIRRAGWRHMLPKHCVNAYCKEM
jgi:hypothetical protein